MLVVDTTYLTGDVVKSICTQYIYLMFHLCMLLSLVYCHLLHKSVMLLVCSRIDIHEPGFCRRFDS